MTKLEEVIYDQLEAEGHALVEQVTEHVVTCFRKRPPSMLENIDGGPSGRCCWRIRERPPSTLVNINGGPPWEVLPKNPGAPTINTRNVDGGPPRRGCWKIWERPPLML
jgi:hypothetical protein